MTVRITTVVDLAEPPAVVGFSDGLPRSRCDGHPIKSFEEWGFFRTHTRSWTSVQPLSSSNFGYRATISDFEDRYRVPRLATAAWDTYRHICLDQLASLCWRIVLPSVLTGFGSRDRKIGDSRPDRNTTASPSWETTCYRFRTWYDDYRKAESSVENACTPDFGKSVPVPPSPVIQKI